MIKKYIYIMWILLFIPLLISCGRSESFHDLRTYLSKLDQSATNQIPQKTILPHAPLATVYQKNSQRSPFEDTTQSSNTLEGSVINPVLRYPLNLLRFVGVVTQNDKIIAYIVTPNNKLYQVSIGDIIGEAHGKVVDIKPYEIKITEPTEGDKPGTERIVTLHLKEELNNAKP